MNYDSTRQLRLAGLITEDYRGTIDNTTNTPTKTETTDEVENESEQQLRNHIRTEIANSVMETRLRNEVRKEIKDMLNKFQEKQLGGWVLSGTKVKKLRSNNSKGKITLGFTGHGFK
jgi:hypothetical protein